MSIASMLETADEILKKAKAEKQANRGKGNSLWKDLNADCNRASEEEAKLMLEEELAGPRRKAYVFRIHARYNRMRAIRERSELIAQLPPVKHRPPRPKLKRRKVRHAKS